MQGSALGLRLQAESWLDLSARSFLSADASYGTAFQEYWSLVRLGYRLTPRFSLGLEGGALGNEEYDAGRGGGFARVNLRAIEDTLSGGFTGKLSGRSAERICGARTLSAVLDFEICNWIDESALPAPLRQCLASSSAGLVCRKPARRGGIALFGVHTV